MKLLKLSSYSTYPEDNLSEVYSVRKHTKGNEKVFEVGGV